MKSAQIERVCRNSPRLVDIHSTAQPTHPPSYHRPSSSPHATRSTHVRPNTRHVFPAGDRSGRYKSEFSEFSFQPLNCQLESVGGKTWSVQPNIVGVH